jgi:hypothetical protein
MAGRHKKTEAERKTASVRLEKDVVLELEVYASLKGKSLSDVIGEPALKWWEAHPEREEIQRLVKKSQPPDPTPQKQSKGKAA